jgi:glycosyltransferase involved in cell wall biosynthesis
LPCYNESITIGKVINDFKQYLPEADIYVYDNNSNDGTDEVARKHGAIVKYERKQGKANVIRSMFREIDADIYVMNDGDDTYPVKDVRKLIKPVLTEGYDMVNGDRLSNGTYASENKRNFHQLGNKMVKRLINRIFKAQLKDIMTGYRAFSKAFVKNYPVLCDGFELETEMSIFALNNKLKLKEEPIDFQERPEGSVSKLNTFSDGFKVIMTIFNLYRHYKPFSFFGLISLLAFVTSIAVGVPVIIEYIKYSYIFKLPSSVLASGLMILSILMFMVGLILDTIAENDRKHFQMSYNNSK